MPERAPASGLRWLALAAVVAALDLATKAWVSAAFRLHEVREVTPFFNLVLVHNTGAAFSFLADAGGWQRWFFVVVSAAISGVLVWMLHRNGANRLLCAALALVLGGALGNLWDRVMLGYVVDFVQLHAGGYYWPAFNVADSAISVGVALLLLDSVRGASTRPEAARESKP